MIGIDKNYMSHFKCLISVMLTFIFWPGVAAAQDISDSVQLLNIQQFEPSLSLNKNPEICAAHQAAWRQVYNGVTQLSPGRLDIEINFPGSQKINVGYGEANYVPFDYDNDENDEIFYIEYTDPASRRPAPSKELFLYESQADVDADLEAHRTSDVEGRFRRRNIRSGKIDGGITNARALGSFRQDATFFSLNGEIYVQYLKTTGRNDPYQAYLDVLGPDPQRTRICELELNPPVSKDDSPIDILQPLSMVVGKGYLEKHGEQCNDGRRGLFPNLRLYTANTLHRPQAIDNLGRRKFTSPEVRDVRREYKYAVWGLSDPTSFEVIKDLKEEYWKFVEEYALYYQIYFDMDADESRDTAERAYRYLLDNAYATSWQGHSFGVGFEDSNIGPETSLKEYANFVVDNAIETKSGHLTALMLGLQTGVETRKLKILSEYAMDLKTRYGRNYSEELDEKVRQPLVDGLFFASLTYPEMMKHFVELGAQVDLPTNYFRKTALMYAAQNNDLDVVNILLSEGADPNSQTKQDEKPCTIPLERDSRTPLMYAAENAEASLILSLLEAGADPLAKDTKGNDILWYLKRNSRLSDGQKENIKHRM